MKIYIKASFDAEVESGQLFKVYHAGNSKFSGWDDSKLHDLGLHCSFKAPRKNKSNVTIIYVDGYSNLATVPDANYWTSLDGFQSIIKGIDKSADSSEIAQIWRNLRNSYDSQGPEISKHLADYIVKTYNIDGLRYRDTEDGVGDWCLCILNPDIIKGYEPVSTSTSKSSKYGRIKNQLEQESLNGIDSLYEQTEAGEYLNSLCQQVEEKLNIYVEPSVQAGIGGVWIWDNSTDQVLVEGYDYNDFNDETIDLALSASNETEFKASYESYLKSMCRL